MRLSASRFPRMHRPTALLAGFLATVASGILNAQNHTPSDATGAENSSVAENALKIDADDESARDRAVGDQRQRESQQRVARALDRLIESCKEAEDASLTLRESLQALPPDDRSQALQVLVQAQPDSLRFTWLTGPLLSGLDSRTSAAETLKAIASHPGGVHSSVFELFASRLSSIEGDRTQLVGDCAKALAVSGLVTVGDPLTWTAASREQALSAIRSTLSHLLRSGVALESWCSSFLSHELPARELAFRMTAMCAALPMLDDALQQELSLHLHSASLVPGAWTAREWRERFAEQPETQQLALLADSARKHVQQASSTSSTTDNQLASLIVDVMRKYESKQPALLLPRLKDRHASVRREAITLLQLLLVDLPEAECLPILEGLLTLAASADEVTELRAEACQATGVRASLVKQQLLTVLSDSAAPSPLRASALRALSNGRGGTAGDTAVLQALQAQIEACAGQPASAWSMELMRAVGQIVVAPEPRDEVRAILKACAQRLTDLNTRIAGLPADQLNPELPVVAERSRLIGSVKRLSFAIGLDISVMTDGLLTLAVQDSVERPNALTILARCRAIYPLVMRESLRANNNPAQLSALSLVVSNASDAFHASHVATQIALLQLQSELTSLPSDVRDHWQQLLMNALSEDSVAESARQRADLARALVHTLLATLPAEQAGAALKVCAPLASERASTACTAALVELSTSQRFAALSTFPDAEAGEPWLPRLQLTLATRARLEAAKIESDDLQRLAQPLVEKLQTRARELTNQLLAEKTKVDSEAGEALGALSTKETRVYLLQPLMQGLEADATPHAAREMIVEMLKGIVQLQNGVSLEGIKLEGNAEEVVAGVKEVRNRLVNAGVIAIGTQGG